MFKTTCKMCGERIDRTGEPLMIVIQTIRTGIALLLVIFDRLTDVDPDEHAELDRFIRSGAMLGASLHAAVHGKPTLIPDASGTAPSPVYKEWADAARRWSLSWVPRPVASSHVKVRRPSRERGR